MPGLDFFVVAPARSALFLNCFQLFAGGLEDFLDAGGLEEFPFEPLDEELPFEAPDAENVT